MKKCPFCGVEVKKENLKRHLLKVHNELEEGEFEEKGLEKPVKAGTKKKPEIGPKKRDRIKKRKRISLVSRIIPVIVIIAIIALVGVIVYQNMNSQNELDGGTNGEGNGGGGNPVAIISTTLGVIKIELYSNVAPTTAGNFINLAKNGFYDGVIFHRVVPGFVIQGGGFTSDGQQKPASQIPWEDTGHKNLKYTVAMARSGDPNTASGSGTATSQFFINLVDNTGLDSYTYPFVVFGKVIEGFSVVDAIGVLPTGTHNGMSDWPDNPPVINGISIEE